MSDSIDPRVTPSLHPDNVSQIDGYDDDTKHLLAPTETAFSEAYLGIAAVHDAREAAARNPTWNEAQQLITVDDFAQKQFQKIAKRFDIALGALNKGIASIEADLSAPIESSASYGVAGEIRKYVADLPSTKRMDFIQQAIRNNDTRTATAILGAPSYLSGIDANMQSVLTRMYHEHHAPDKAKRLKAMRGGAELLGERMGLVFAAIESAIGAPPRKIAKLREAKNAAEKHFAAQGA